MVNTRIKPLALAVALCALGPAALATPVSAAHIQEKVTVTPAKTITRDEQAAISSAGVKVLRHIAQARGDIHHKDAEGARTELDQTGKLLDIIQAALPTTEVKDRIWVARKHLEYENTQEVLPDLVPIYASLDELIDIMPTDRAKAHLDQASAHLKSGDREKARADLDATAGALSYIEVDLPLDSTRSLVDQARAALNKENWDEADKVLKSAEDSTVYLSVALDQPLFTAQTLIWQTVVDLDAAHRDLARSDLQDAISYLELAGQSDDQATRDAAQKLLDQARQLQRDMKGETDLGGRARQLWEHTRALADRSLEYLAADWARYRTGSPLKSDLIEARLHLANARIDLFTGHETGRAGEELQAARQFLDRAAGQARNDRMQAGYLKQLTDLQTSVNQLGTDPAVAKASRYAMLENRLQGMIRLQ